MNNINKVISLIGFARKSNAIQIGLDNINYKTKLILFSSEVSENSKSKIENIRIKNNCNTYLLDAKQAENLLFNNIKVLGITNINLATEIYSLLTNGGK